MTKKNPKKTIKPTSKKPQNNNMKKTNQDLSVFWDFIQGLLSSYCLHS